MFLNAGAADSLKKNRSQKLTTGYKEQKSADCFNQMKWERERNEHCMWGKLRTSRAQSRSAIRRHGEDNVRVVFEKMKNLSENHAEVISGFLFACFSLLMASTAHKAWIPMPKLAQEHLNFMLVEKKVWNGGMGWYGYGSYPSNRYGPRTCLEPWLLAKASMKSQPLALYENMFFFTQSLYKMKVYDHILQPQDCPDILLKMITYALPRKT